MAPVALWGSLLTTQQSTGRWANHVALAGDDARKAAQVLDEVQEVLEQTSWMAGAGDKNKKQRLEAVASALSGSLASSEPPDCKGQEHHPISRPVARELSRHPTLKGLFAPRDPRFVARALDEKAHCGYQTWHREVDKELIDWLKANPRATPQDFVAKLREIFNRPEMRARFPHGF